MDYVEPHCSREEESITKERLKKCFPFFSEFSSPNWILSSSFLKINCLTCSHCHKPTIYKLYFRKTSLWDYPQYPIMILKDKRQRTTLKKRSWFISEKERPSALSASDADVGQAVPVLIRSQANGKIMGRPTTRSYTEQKKWPSLHKRFGMKKNKNVFINLKIHISIQSTLLCWKSKHIKKCPIVWSSCE